MSQPFQFLEQALEKAQEAEDNILLEAIYESLSETYFAKGDTFMVYSFLTIAQCGKG